MNDDQKGKLEGLLWELCDTQDTITHELDKGRMGISSLKKLRKRDMAEIVEFVESISCKCEE